MSNTKTLAKGTFWGIVGLFVLKFLAWFYYIILARMVSQEEIGIFSIALSIISIVVLFSDLGLGSGSVGRYIPYYFGKKEFNKLRAALKISISVGTIFSILCMILVFVFAGSIASFYHNTRLQPVLYLMAFYLLAYNLYNLTTNFLVGRKLIKLSSYTSSIQGLGKLVFTVALILLVEPTAENISLGLIISYFFAAGIGFLWLLREYKKIPSSDEKTSNPKMLAEMVPFGLTIVVLSSMYLLNSQFDSIMLGHLLPADINMKMVGVYALVISLSTIIPVFASSIGSIFHPLINELWAQENTDEMKKVSSSYFRWVALLTTPVLVMVLAFSSELLTVLYGSSYSIGATSFIFYSLGLFIYSFSYPIQNTLSGMRRLDVTTKIVFSGLVFNIILNLLLIKPYGIDGSAFASMISFSIMTVLFLRIRKTTYQEIPKDIHKAFLAGITALVILMALKYVTNGFGFSGLDMPSNDISGDFLRKMLKAAFLLVIAAITSLIYLVFLIILKSFHKEDIEILCGGMRRIKIPETIVCFTSRLLLRE